MFIDLAAGIGIYVLVSTAYSIPFHIVPFLGTIYFAFLPDTDIIPFLLLRKRLNLISHHLIHYPLIFVPGVFVLARIFSDWYIPTLYILSVVFHFLHDSTSKTGVRWFGLPFLGGTSYQLTWRGFVPTDREKILAELYRTRSARSVRDEITMRWEKVGLKTIGFLLVSLMLLSVFIYFST